MAATVETKSLLLWAIVLCFLSTHLITVVGVRNSLLSKQDDEQKELDRQLNKPLVRTIQTEWGDISDCVDITKQPAFDHPLLKNHKIQMKPSHLPEKVERVNDESLSPTSLSILGSHVEGCSKGTVPIGRIPKEDLIRVKSLSPIDDTGIFKKTGVVYQSNGEKFFGASGDIAVYNPKLSSDDQFSVTEIVILTGPLNNYTGIHVGWTVNPSLYGDNLTRLFVYWTADSGRTTGCYNNNCPGFVHVNSRVILGAPISPISSRGGDQYIISVSIYQDKITKVWWLDLNGNVTVGYWPSSIVPSMKNGVDSIYWGGMGLLSVTGIGPEIGSGSFPTGSFDWACYFRNMQFVDGEYKFTDPERAKMVSLAECTANYGVSYYGNTDRFGHSMEFGGMGGVCPKHI